MADLPDLTLPLPAPDLVARVNATEDRVAALEADSGTSGVDIQVGGSQPAEGWWLDTGQPIPGIPVTPTGPTWTDDDAHGGGTWTTPTETGVTYSPASGTADPEQQVTVQAFAQTGYQLQGTTSWTHTFPAAPPPPSATLTFLGQATSEADAGPYTFAAQALGAADPTRSIIVAVHGRPGAQGTPSVSGVSVAGVAAVKDHGPISGTGGSPDCVSIWRAAVPSGTVGDVVVTWSGADSRRCGISMWSLTGGAASVAAVSTGGSTAAANIVATASTLVAATRYAPAGGVSWTGATSAGAVDVEGLQCAAARAAATGATSIRCHIDGVDSAVAAVAYTVS